MRQHLEDAHRRGQPLAALYASEGLIYGSFGYGVASLNADKAPAAPRAAPSQAPMRTSSWGSAAMRLVTSGVIAMPLAVKIGVMSVSSSSSGTARSGYGMPQFSVSSVPLDHDSEPSDDAELVCADCRLPCSA